MRRPPPNPVFSYSVTQSALSKTSTDVASRYNVLRVKIKNNCPGTDVPEQHSGFRFASLDCVHSTRDDNCSNGSGDRYEYAHVLAGTEVSGSAETSSADQQKMCDIAEIKKINISVKALIAMIFLFFSSIIQKIPYSFAETVFPIVVQQRIKCCSSRGKPS